jgi:RNA polymerase sigma-70 factor (ECF subfamily)
MGVGGSTMSSAIDAQTEGLTDRELDRVMVELVLGGDATAYRALVEKYQDRVFAIVYGILRNREDAKDVTQEAFVKAYRSLEGFRLESSFYTWLYRIATNLAIDLTRRKKRRETSPYEEGQASRDGTGAVAEIHHGDGPARLLERKQLYARIMDAMQQLPPDQRQVVLLRELEGLSYREIAEVMEIPEGTVMSRLFYARKRLQKLLASTAPTAPQEAS